MTLRVTWLELFDGSVQLNDPGEALFIDIAMFDIPETIEAAVRNLARNRRVESVSVANYGFILDAARRGQIDGRPVVLADTLARHSTSGADHG